MSSNDVIPKDIKNFIDDSTKSKLEMFYNNTQETLERGFDSAFETLNSSLITTINSAFNSFESEHERRLEQNRENHEKAMSGLNSQYTTTQNFYSGNKDKEKAQTISIVDNFARIKNNRKKAMIFYALKKNYLKEKNLRNKHNNIMNHLNFRKKYLIFNSWRNITNSYTKTKLKLINNQHFLEESKKITQNNEDETLKEQEEEKKKNKK